MVSILIYICKRILDVLIPWPIAWYSQAQREVSGTSSAAKPVAPAAGTPEAPSQPEAQPVSEPAAAARQPVRQAPIVVGDSPLKAAGPMASPAPSAEAAAAQAEFPRRRYL